MSAERVNSSRGFTLLEVLVALAIVALGLIGVFGQLSQSATSASRLREKTLADWVALNVITELRLAALRGQFPKEGTSSKDVEMANAKWHWQMKVADTGTELRRAEVTVSLADKPDRPLALATGFLVQHPSNRQLAATGWPPWDLAALAAGEARRAQGQQTPAPGQPRQPVNSPTPPAPPLEPPAGE